MIRYPVFSFHGDSIFVLEAPEEVRGNLEVAAMHIPIILLDSEGQELTRVKIGRHTVELSESGGVPDPERLRLMLRDTLRKWGQTWDDNAPLADLISATLAYS